VDSYQEYRFAKNEPTCYNHGRNQSSVAEMIIRPITETAYVQTLPKLPDHYVISLFLCRQIIKRPHENLGIFGVD
jgi:hypothetical protein